MGKGKQSVIIPAFPSQLRKGTGVKVQGYGGEFYGMLARKEKICPVRQNLYRALGIDALIPAPLIPQLREGTGLMLRVQAETKEEKKKYCLANSHIQQILSTLIYYIHTIKSKWERGNNLSCTTVTTNLILLIL